MAGGPIISKPVEGAPAILSRRPVLAFLLAAVTWMSASSLVGAVVAVVPARTPGALFAPQAVADRIVLTPGADPAREMAVAYRTDPYQSSSEAQIARAVDGPALEDLAVDIRGAAPPRAVESASGPALYHQIRFAGLEPDTVYAYRVKGAAGWSEWLQFKTASAIARPFRFLYLGDVQNGILSDASRVIRQAFGAHGAIELVLHAGDLVDQRGAKDHDEEWGEWNAAGGHHFAMTPQIPAAGNHEYDNLFIPKGGSRRQLGLYWPLQFLLPGNGAPKAKQTTYYVDYQGVRFIVLDGTSALDLGTLDAQTRWLDDTLAKSSATWNVVLMHQPVFSCGRARDEEALKAALMPVFEKRNVDLVLQGHDHCYSRLTADRADGEGGGPLYMVSVAGSKMYALTDRAAALSSRTAEATQLYQLIDVTEARLDVRVYTATGQLYDHVTVERGAGGRTVVRESDDVRMAERKCDGGVSADGTDCRLRSKRIAFGL